jgi:aspartate kinase
MGNQILVMKFGGTSVRDHNSRSAAARQIGLRVEQGFPVVVVVSAMGRKGEPYATDTLIGLLSAQAPDVDAETLDLALSCGETLSAAFFAHLLTSDGIPARALTGGQAGILTDGNAGGAEIISIDPAPLLQTLKQGQVAVVAGFQGTDSTGTIRTLGRGGSDTSAVALGAALGAAEVLIFTDVNGIAVADPRRLAEAPFLERISADQSLAMAEEGSKVLHPRALTASLATGTPIRVCNTFTDLPGTLVHHQPAGGPCRAMALAHREGLLLLTIPAGDPVSMVPELIPAGGDLYLLLDDVYSGRRLALLRQTCAEMTTESGWATVSLILSCDADRDQFTVSGAGDTGVIPTAPDRRSFLVPENGLNDLLARLFTANF